MQSRLWDRVSNGSLPAPLDRLLRGERRFLIFGSLAAVLLVLGIFALVPSGTKVGTEAEREPSNPLTDSQVAPSAGPEAEAAQGEVSGIPSATKGQVSPKSSGAAAVNPKVAVTSDSINIGILFRVVSSEQAQVVSRGEEGGGIDDFRPHVRAVADYINAHGGMGGRQVNLIFSQWDVLAQSWAAEHEKACRTFTQDNKVFAVANGGNPPHWQDFASCLAKRNTIWVVSEQQQSIFDQRSFDDYAPYVYRPGHLRGDRWGAIVELLAEGGYFDPGTVLGAIYTNDRATKWTLDQVVKPSLERYGQKIVEEAGMTPSDSVDGLGENSSEQQNAILRFRSAQVNHLMAVGAGVGLFFFTEQAESQRWRPRYAFTSIDQQGTASNANQYSRALTVGWLPGGPDVHESQRPPDNPGLSLCRKIMRDKGLDASQLNALYYCGQLFFLKDGLDRAAEPTPAAFRAAMDKLGTGHLSPFSFSNRFDPGRFDGAGGLRLANFDGSCNCFKYTGQVRQAP